MLIGMEFASRIEDANDIYGRPDGPSARFLSSPDEKPEVVRQPAFDLQKQAVGTPLARDARAEPLADDGRLGFEVLAGVYS